MNVGFGEVVTLAVVALLVFGPERLPEVAGNVGRMVSRFRREVSSTFDELKRTADLEDLRGVADDLRNERDELKRSVSMAGSAPARRMVDASGPAPFDPDAT